MNHAYRRMLARQARSDALSVLTDIVRSVACALVVLAIVWATFTLSFVL